jgi:hypothetical protein
MIYYKVVYNCGEMFSSAAVSGRYCVSYKVGVKTIAPKGTKLFVFKDLKSAEEFTWRGHPNIFKCKVENPRPIKFIDGNIYTSSISSFWEAKRRRKKPDSHVKPAPRGTLACDSVTLLERINSWFIVKP